MVSNDIKEKYFPPEWAFLFHGHRCPFMPIGYRMGMIAMEYLQIEREKDHGFFVFPELGEGHPQTCLIDGIQASTSATYGKVLISKTFWGKLAAVFYHPDKGAVRISLLPDFIDEMGKFEFFSYRKRGIEPSKIPDGVVNEVIDWVFTLSNNSIYKIQDMPGYNFTPIKGSFARDKCEICGEYVFERYIRIKNGKKVCIPCSGYADK